MSSCVNYDCVRIETNKIHERTISQRERGGWKVCASLQQKKSIVSRDLRLFVAREEDERKAIGWRQNTLANRRFANYQCIQN
jgi:hypothetical protein